MDEVEEKKPRIHDIFAWKSLNRPAREYSKEVFSTLGAVVLLVSIILAFFQEWLAIVVAWAAFFLFWQLSKMAPQDVDHKITTEGVISMSHSYMWGELGPFWYSQRGPDLQLHIAHGNIFGQLIMLVDPKDREKITEELAQYLPYIELPQKSTVEKFSDWFAKKFPLEPKNSSVEAPVAPEV